MQMKHLVPGVVMMALALTACGTMTSSASHPAACSLAGFSTFYAYTPNPLPGGSGQTAAIGPTILRMNDLTVTPANEGSFQETVGPHCLLHIRWTPTGSANTYRFTLAANGTLTVVNANAGLALSIAGGRSE